MSDTPTGPPSDSADAGAGADLDTGEPIAALAALRVAPRVGFLERIRRAIHRRQLASEVVDFSWASPVAVFMQFIAMLFEGLGPRKGGPRHG